MAPSTGFSAAATSGGDAVYRIAQTYAQSHNNVPLRPDGVRWFYWTGIVPAASLDEATDEYYFLKFPGNFTLVTYRLYFPAQGAGADFDVVTQNDSGTEQIITAAAAPTTAAITIAPEFYGSQPAESGWSAFWGARYNIANKYLGIKCAAPGAAPVASTMQLLVGCYIGEIPSLV